MLNMRRIGFLSLLGITLIFPLSAAYQLVLQAGHEGSPAAIEWHAESGNVVTAGNDGRLIVTRPDDGKVLHRFRVADGYINDMKISPTDDLAAVVTLKDGKYVVAVWDWSDEKNVYTYESETEPLFTSWSAQGHYLIIGSISTPSIIVLEGQTGRRLSYLQRLPSIYNAGYIGSSETTLMTYNSSGAIRYWDIRSSALKLSADTESNLQGIAVLQTDSKTTLFGYRNDTVFLINRQTGAVLDQRTISGLRSVSVDEDSGDIDLLSRGTSGDSLQEYRVQNDRFIPRVYGTNALSNNAVPVVVDRSVKPEKVLRRNSSTYLFTESGKLFLYDGGRFKSVIQSHLWRPNSLAFKDDTLMVTGGSVIREFTSPFFGENDGTEIKDLATLSLNVRQTGSGSLRTGIAVLPGGDILQWDIANAGAGNGLRRISAVPGAPELFFPVSGMILKAELVDSGRLMIVDRSGTVSIRNIQDGTVLFEYSALGILDAGYSKGNNYFLVGRSSQGRAGTPLEQVDSITKESVPIPDNRFMIYGITAGPQEFYSLGVIRQTAENPETLLLSHDEKRPEEGKMVMEVAGEHMNAIVLPHPGGNSIYTTLGGTVQRIAGSRKTPFKWNEGITELKIHGDVLYGLDTDGALVLWDSTNGTALLKAYMFDDGEWIAMQPDGDTIWASPGAIEHVMVYRNGKPVDPERVSQIIPGTNGFPM